MYFTAISARPAAMTCGTVKVACSRFGSSVTRAVCVLPPAAMVTVSNVISAAFRVIVREGFSSVTVIRSVAVKLAAGRFGSTAIS